MSKEIPMTNDTMTKRSPERAEDRSSIGHWSLGFGHSLVIGHWSLVIKYRSLVIESAISPTKGTLP
jgi:hypothetical protein